MLYPVELRAHRLPHCRAKIAPPAGRCRVERAKVVGVEGFEPPTPCSQSRCATRLRYTPPLLARRCAGRASERGRDTTNAVRFRQSGQAFAGIGHRQKTKGAEAPFVALSGAPGEIRTPDHQVRSLVLYP